MTTDELHRRKLDQMLEVHGVSHVTDADRQHLNTASPPGPTASLVSRDFAPVTVDLAPDPSFDFAGSSIEDLASQLGC